MRLSEISELLGTVLEGNPDLEIARLNKIEDALNNEISFLHNEKYFPQIDTTEAGAVIVPSNFKTDRDISLLKAENPYATFTKLLIFMNPEKPLVKSGINKLTEIDNSVQIDENPAIGAFVSIGENTRIGKNVVIMSNVSIDRDVTIGDNVLIYSNVSIRNGSVIGNNVILQNNCVIGSDGFGFAMQNDSQYGKIPQVGIVILEDNVEIGANTVVDRATLGSTIISKGTKLDNLIQVAHNVKIGSNTVIAAQTGISGSTKIGNNCMIGGQVGFVGHITVGNNVMIGAQAGVNGNVKEGSVVTGTPVRDMTKQRKIDASLSRVPDMIYDIKDLKKAVKALEEKSN
ncbi:MAG: UDP-3-O-(3-hydroxymyristoyl)glucosamine N-acyltransferase [Candidatus Delongbacteria bacterium]|nr:UDP-3-O-(3-hydroxymyristoyl)glucosamine N-acyltransferase [Candidatus Delongbacteria bacterium]MBN2836203.1 UDP-3-O-(3-hydroxymyristoyl)glucosamine N-acyltransferase [Candidatus Delongbacteria bacterium]